MKIISESGFFQRWHKIRGGEHIAAADVRIVTSGRRSVLAHSSVLASASPVLESKLDQQQNLRSLEREIQILGVPCDAVVAFVGFLYSSKSALTSEDANEAMEKYGMHLLVLSHSYRVVWLKKVCVDGLTLRLAAEKVVDMLQLARRFDAPRLYHKCMQHIAKDFDYVQQTEAWRFLQSHDNPLELEILQFLQEADQSKVRRRRQKEEHETYEQLNEAMECLHHICTEGCTEVGPVDGEPPHRNKGPCTNFRTCQALQLLIRHFAACRRKLHCPHFKRMSQLFRLHSSICDMPIESCKVPFCKQFKVRNKQSKVDNETWRLLVKKMIIVRVMSTVAKRTRSEQQQKQYGLDIDEHDS